MEESTDDIPQFWDGKKFWFSANFPMKSYYQARVKVSAVRVEFVYDTYLTVDRNLEQRLFILKSLRITTFLIL